MLGQGSPTCGSWPITGSWSNRQIATRGPSWCVCLCVRTWPHWREPCCWCLRPYSCKHRHEHSGCSHMCTYTSASHKIIPSFLPPLVPGRQPRKVGEFCYRPCCSIIKSMRPNESMVLFDFFNIWYISAIMSLVP